MNPHHSTFMVGFTRAAAEGNSLHHKMPESACGRRFRAAIAASGASRCWAASLSFRTQNMPPRFQYSRFLTVNRHCFLNLFIAALTSPTKISRVLTPKKLILLIVQTVLSQATTAG